jgi:hypothetical protein
MSEILLRRAMLIALPSGRTDQVVSSCRRVIIGARRFRERSRKTRSIIASKESRGLP